MKINIGVIFGGRSGEHEISIRSAKAVIENIDAEKYFGYTDSDIAGGQSG